jgi:hypothetical protein
VLNMMGQPTFHDIDSALAEANDMPPEEAAEMRKAAMEAIAGNVRMMLCTVANGEEKEVGDRNSTATPQLALFSFMFSLFRARSGIVIGHDLQARPAAFANPFERFAVTTGVAQSLGDRHRVVMPVRSALNVIHQRNVFGISGEGIQLPQVRLKNLLAKLAARVAFRQEVEKLFVHERAARSHEGRARQTIGWLLPRPIKREFFVRRLGTRHVDVSEQGFQSIHDPWPCRPASAAPERLRPIGPQLADRVKSVMAAERHAGFQQKQIATASSHRAQRGGGILQMIQKPVAIHDIESSGDRSIQRFHIALNKFPA